MIENLTPGWGQISMTIKLVFAAVIGLAIAVPTAGWMVTRHTLAGVRQWQATVVSVTSTAGHVIDKNGKPALIVADAVPDQIKKLGDALDQIDTTQKIAQVAQHGNNTRIGGAQTAVGKKVDDDLDKNLPRDRADADRFIFSGGVRPARATGAGNQGVAGSIRGTPEATSPNPPDAAGTVSVLDDDVRTCTENTRFLIELQTWVRGIADISLDAPDVVAPVPAPTGS